MLVYLDNWNVDKKIIGLNVCLKKSMLLLGVEMVWGFFCSCVGSEYILKDIYLLVWWIVLIYSVCKNYE